MNTSPLAQQLYHVQEQMEHIQLELKTATAVENYLKKAIEGDKNALDCLPVYYLDLDVRSQTVLVTNGIGSIGQLVAKTEKELTAIPGLGRTSLVRIKHQVELAKLSFAK